MNAENKIPTPWHIRDHFGSRIVKLSDTIDESCHEYKVWPEFYDMIERRRKKFEVRKNDRDETIQPGDTVLLREWCPETKRYTGKSDRRLVTYVLYGTEGGFLPPGLLVFAISDESF